MASVDRPVGAGHHLATLCLPVVRRLDFLHTVQHQVLYILDYTLVCAWDVAFSRKDKTCALKMGAASNCSCCKVLEYYNVVLC
jgi:hypothetical protein